MSKLRAFGAFWYDFVIGDDWLVAAGVVIALAITYAVSRTSVPAWWPEQPSSLDGAGQSM